MRFWACGLLLGAFGLMGCGGAAPFSNTDEAATSDAPARGLLGGLLQTRAPAAEAEPGLPLARVSVARGDVVVAGPEGYCVDPATTQARRGFAVIASCMILSEGKAGTAVPPVVVTVTVGPPGTGIVLPDPASLAMAAQTELLSGAEQDGLVTAQLATGGDAVLEDGDARYWRGAFVKNGHLVGLALYAPGGSAFAGEGGAGMLARVRASIDAGS